MRGITRSSQIGDEVLEEEAETEQKAGNHNISQAEVIHALSAPREKNQFGLNVQSNPLFYGKFEVVSLGQRLSDRLHDYDQTRTQHKPLPAAAVKFCSATVTITFFLKKGCEKKTQKMS